ncbi:MAG: hypothetical protein A3F16_01665 [Deltaproteobacteria bacterium RIFCSPHIGHO2_12_FULL_43_9]|nr:MAG: hypothetical protein A3F16_01665 [Deltaproteobacteria bacterium RIFCSPHIGHO2_12_FULL_43_9]
MFSFDLAMQNLIEDIIENCAYFQHVDLGRVAISVKPSKVSGLDGVYAQIFPLRYKNGAFSGVEKVGNRLERYRVDPVYRGRREMLYILYFYLPRFFNLSFIEKMTTIFHELYHISPEFNGDLRRFPGKNFMHGVSVGKYDSLMTALAKDYLFRTSSLEKSDFLRFGSRSVEKRYGKLLYSRLPEPSAFYVGRVHSKKRGTRKKGG